MSLFGDKSSSLDVLAFPEVIDQWSEELEYMFEYTATGRPEYSPDEIDLSNYISLLAPYLPAQKVETRSMDDFVDEPGVDDVHGPITAEINLGAAFGQAAAAERGLVESEIESLLDDAAHHFTTPYFDPYDPDSELWSPEFGTDENIMLNKFGFNVGVRNHGLIAEADEPMSIAPEKESRYEKVYLWPGDNQMPQMKNLPVFNKWISYDS